MNTKPLKAIAGILLVIVGIAIIFSSRPIVLFIAFLINAIVGILLLVHSVFGE